jgi:formylglycine-generating enzyme required for sulfatase activity
MSLVPGGTYPLGDAERRVAPFLMDAVEVTAAAYAGCVRVGRCDASGLDACGELGTYDPPGRRSHPINCVDWDQAAAFCAWAGKRLPTEEEWEWAARGAARGTRFPWGNGRPARQLCWDGPGNDAGEGGRIGTCRVGSYLAGNSPQGISDLAGNVWEWTADETGSTGERIVRGGGWGSGGPTLISANHRETHPGDHRDVAIGFRCVKNAE